MASGGVSGLSLVVGTAGAVLVYSAIRNRSVPDTLRALVRGEQLDVRPAAADYLGPEGTGAPPEGGSDLGRAVAQTALSYIGVPYVWAGETPSGWDCSGFVTWVLHHDHGIELPDNHHTVSAQFLIWRGATSLPRNAAQPGDLVCFPSHVGIVVDRDHMVNAPGIGKKTRLDRIWRLPVPVIRRPNAYRGQLATASGSRPAGSAQPQGRT